VHSAPGLHTPPPVTHAPYAPASRQKPKRTGLIVAASVVGVVVVLGVIGSLLSNGTEKDKTKDDAAASQGANSSGSNGSGGAGAQKKTDPKPVSYQGIDLTEGYQIMLADNPPRPVEGEDLAYGNGDLYFSVVRFLDEAAIGTANGKFVLLNNTQKGSLATCRTETRYTEEISLTQLGDGSQFCVLSDAGHVAVATYRGKSGDREAGSYVTVDLQIWRNAEEAKTD
jgi:hypothetical protein